LLSKPPTYAEDVPAELAAICKRALARDPAARFASADELRSALVAFQSHASARALSREASARLRVLEERAVDVGDRDVEVARAFAACRFGFEQSLRIWPESQEAQEGLRRALVAVAGYEIGRRHVDAARVLVDEIADPPRGLCERLAALLEEVRKSAEEQARLHDVVRNIDPQLEQRPRGALFLAIAFVWAALTCAAGWASRAGMLHLAHFEFVVGHAVMVAAFVLGRRWMRKKIGGTKVSRDLLNGFLAMLSAGTGIWLVMWAGDVPVPVAMSAVHVIFTLTLFLTASFVDRRMLPTAGIAATGMILPFVFPHHSVEVNGLVALGVAGHLVFAWR
jgi:serine/threonine-protein kinase